MMDLDFLWIRGDTHLVTNLIKDWKTGDPFDPDGHVIRLLKPDNTQQGDDMTSPTKNGVGDYEQEVTVPADAVLGWWIIDWQIVIGTKVGTKRIRFKVIE